VLWVNLQLLYYIIINGQQLIKLQMLHKKKIIYLKKLVLPRKTSLTLVCENQS
jgi:hypothetical protein